MPITDTNPSSSAIYNSVKGVMALFDSTNKTNANEESDQNIEQEDEYESSYTEEDVIVLTQAWLRDYIPYYNDIEPTQKLSFEYWLGKQKVDSADAVEGRDTIDNLIFEAVETFLPIATRANPDPLVNSDATDAGQKLANDLKNFLVYQADKQKLRMKLKKVARHWLFYRIGVARVEFDPVIGDITTEIVNPKRMIFDKDGHIDESGHFVGEYLGERKKASASTLIELFPSKKESIEKKCNKKLGTKLEYICWQYRGTDVFYTLDSIVLGKYKNPNWNYDGTVKQRDPDTGAEVEVEVQGSNHLPSPFYNYVFLAIFNTGLQPHDDTSLILQNIPMQDMINKRFRQIDKNVDSQNNGIIVSGTSFTGDQAAQAASTLRMGGAILVPNGDINGAIKRDSAPQLASDIWDGLNDARGELRNIFGTSGATPQGVASEDTARGKILVNQLDASRIGGGVTEYIEQFADSLYNMWVQMMYVHYDEPHYVNAIGLQGAAEVIGIRNSDLAAMRQITITVKEGSLIPKDPLTQRNEAIDLWSANALDPRTLYSKLDFPDPDEAAKQLLLWQLVQAGTLPPQMYVPDIEIPVAPVNLPQDYERTGDVDVNAPTGTDVDTVSPDPGSQTAVQAQGQQMLSSVPL